MHSTTLKGMDKLSIAANHFRKEMEAVIADDAGDAVSCWLRNTLIAAEGRDFTQRAIMLGCLHRCAEIRGWRVASEIFSDWALGKLDSDE